jgi:hypothetical protein
MVKNTSTSYKKQDPLIEKGIGSNLDVSPKTYDMTTHGKQVATGSGIQRFMQGRLAKEGPLSNFKVQDAFFVLAALGAIGLIYGYETYTRTKGHKEKNVGTYRIIYDKAPIGSNGSVRIIDLKGNRQIYYSGYINELDAHNQYISLDTIGAIQLFLNTDSPSKLMSLKDAVETETGLTVGTGPTDVKLKNTSSGLKLEPGATPLLEEED